MKIFLSFLQDSEAGPYAIPAYRFWTYYIKQGIEEAAMEWSEVPGLDWAAGLVPHEGDPELNKWKDYAWTKTLQYIRTNRESIDVFLSYLYPKQVEISAISEIRKLGIPCINFYCDHIREFRSVPDEFKVFDLVWVPEYEAIPMYKRAKMDFIHLPMPMWVNPADRTCPAVERSSVSFIGSKDLLRQQLLSQVICKGLPVEIRGSGWQPGYDEEDRQMKQVVPWNVRLANQINFVKKFGLRGLKIKYSRLSVDSSSHAIPAEFIFQSPDHDEYIRITRECSVALGVNRVPTFKAFNTNPLVYSRLRDLEAPMLGACYLTEYTEGLNNLYHIGREIETYTDAGELTFKCKELLQHAAKRRELRLYGQKKALEAHSIPVSLHQLKIKLFR